jgi:xylan 1,4-beta-xylosidase
MVICLSGQHEMVKDFTGFRNFFTLNFIAKPIYNAYRLAAKLGESVLSSECENEFVSVIPTKNDKGENAVLLCYCDKNLTDALPEIEETVKFEDDISDKTVTIYCIDKKHTNPYRLFETMGSPENPTQEQLSLLRNEGELKPLSIQSGKEEICIKLTPNSTYLIEVK